MSEGRFGALKELKHRTVEPIEPHPPLETPEGVEKVEVRRGLGRPVGGKRSNPDYERISLIIKKSTRRAVDFQLLKNDKAEDISDVVDRLLSEWAG